MGNKADDERYDRERQSFAQQIEDGATLERIADAVERLVIAADSIATALSLLALKTAPTQETLDELMLRHERIVRPTDG